MTTNYLQRSQAELDALTSAFASAESALMELKYRAANPQCGKPGKGFKAARKLQPAIRAWQAELSTCTSAINTWITRKGKSGAMERERRLARVREQLPDWTL